MPGGVHAGTESLTNRSHTGSAGPNRSRTAPLGNLPVPVAGGQPMHVAPNPPPNAILTPLRRPAPERIRRYRIFSFGVAFPPHLMIPDVAYHSDHTRPASVRRFWAEFRVPGAVSVTGFRCAGRRDACAGPSAFLPTRHHLCPRLALPGRQNRQPAWIPGRSRSCVLP